MRTILFGAFLLVTAIGVYSRASFTKARDDPLPGPLLDSLLLGIAKEEFAKVKDGMTEEDVEKVLGKECQKGVEPPLTTKNWRIGVNKISIVFRDQKVWRRSLTMHTRQRPGEGPPKPPPFPKLPPPRRIP